MHRVSPACSCGKMRWKCRRGRSYLPACSPGSRCCMISDGMVQATPQLYGEPLALEQDLRQVVRGEVRFDEGSRALYSTDASNYRQLPIGVVIPLDEEDIVAAVAAVSYTHLRAHETDSYL